MASIIVSTLHYTPKIFFKSSCPLTTLNNIVTNLVKKIFMFEDVMSCTKLYYFREEPEVVTFLCLQLRVINECNHVSNTNTANYQALCQTLQLKRCSKYERLHTCFHWKLLMTLSCP